MKPPGKPKRESFFRWLWEKNDPGFWVLLLRYRVPRGGFRAPVGLFSQGRRCRALAEVKIQEGESIESALRRFKRKVQQEDIIKDIKKHSFYLKPGDKRRAKQALARKRSRKKQRRDTE
jgi:small subunit ribosomal protein S21